MAYSLYSAHTDTLNNNLRYMLQVKVNMHYSYHETKDLNEDITAQKLLQ